MPSTWLCGDKFGTMMPHHASVRALWELKWKPLCAINAYPFYYARVEDMAPVIDDLEEKGINDAYSDAWTETFMPHLEAIQARAKEAEDSGSSKEAESLYLRAASLCMIARFPIINSPLKRSVFTLQKELYLHGTSFWSSPVQALSLPHTHASSTDNDMLHVFIQRPSTPAKLPVTPTPVFVALTGLDAYRTDISPDITSAAITLGFTHLSLEITGTGDSPGTPADPCSGDRQLSTLLDWIESRPEEFDASRIVLRGMSTGGYDALRAAHVHATRLALVFAHGAPSDMAFSEEWLEYADGGEYPTPITEAMRRRFGFESVQEMKSEARERWSLLKTGILDKECANVVLLNGMDDTIFPIEDSIIALQHGKPKLARLYPHSGHMGEPGATPVVIEQLKGFLQRS